MCSQCMKSSVKKPILYDECGSSSVGRALASQAEGRGFEPRLPLTFHTLPAPRDPKFFEGQRILFREIISQRFVLTYIDESIVIDRSLYIAKPNFDNQDQTKAIVGQLASKLLIWLFRLEKNEFDDLFPKIRHAEFKELPIKKDLTDQQAEEISLVVTQIISLKKDKPKADTSALESQIDQLVYQLYDLTAEEIATIENSTNKC
jgi:adenine-specific DNA-methyltransferase